MIRPGIDLEIMVIIAAHAKSAFQIEQVTEAALAKFFEDCGSIMDCRVCGDPHTAMRFAFIEFEQESSVSKVLLRPTVSSSYPYACVAHVCLCMRVQSGHAKGSLMMQHLYVILRGLKHLCQVKLNCMMNACCSARLIGIHAALPCLMRVSCLCSMACRPSS